MGFADQLKSNKPTLVEQSTLGRFNPGRKGTNKQLLASTSLIIEELPEEEKEDKP